MKRNAGRVIIDTYYFIGNDEAMLNNERSNKIIGQIMTYLLVFVPKTLVKRIVAMILLTADIPIPRVMELSGLCERSVRELRMSMEEKDASELLTLKNGSGSRSKTKGLEDEIIAEVERGNYHTRQQIADMIEDRFHVRISVTAVARLLKKNGVKRLKTGSLPAKADAKEQREFYDGVLCPLMEKAEKGSETLLFMDASHFVMGCDFLGYIYGKARRFIRTSSGRKRYNVLGAIDFRTKRMLTVTNDSYITATQVCEMLRLIAKEYEGKVVHIVLDNARYQKCADVCKLAGELGIDLIYLPPYSPNLNLIERLWKFVKGELRSRYYDSFPAFRERIDAIISSFSDKNKATISKLIGKRVQIFDGLDLLCPDTFIIAS